jgi:hypothetical protein
VVDFATGVPVGSYLASYGPEEPSAHAAVGTANGEVLAGDMVIAVPTQA